MEGAHVQLVITQMLHLLHWWTTDFFAQPWSIYEPGKKIWVDGKPRTQLEVRQKMYENIIDECVFVSRASEGALSSEWLMNQPIFMRKKFVKSFEKELKERKAALERRSHK